MSAAKLREAATQIREDHPWDQPNSEFYTAVADLLDGTADHIADLAASGFSQPSVAPNALRSLAVARAYLGDAA